MKVLCVCKFNQARSIAMASAIKHFYPHLEIQSAGTHCESGDPVPMLTLETLTEWGIEPIARVSTPLHKSIRNQEFDLILCADDSVRRDVTTSLGGSERVVDISGLTSRSELIPVDPSRSGFQHFQEQLGKVIFLAIRAIRRRLIPEGQQNYSLLLSGDSGDFLARKAVLWALAEGKTIIDCNWSRSNVEGWSKLSRDLGVPLNLFSPMSHLPSEGFRSGHINVSRFESDDYAREILSQDWMVKLSEQEKPGHLLVSGFQLPEALSRTHLALGLTHSDQPCAPYLI